MLISNFRDAKRVWKSVYVDCVDFSSYVFAIVCNKSQKSSEKRSTTPTNAGSLTYDWWSNKILCHNPQHVYTAHMVQCM
ncbi:hypothetical protein DPEC_G00208620 [Dallia pectoralis]|uniref:Uncharacterized protein n=1 Tax=Dallia pectoralis TaxID=75939 RepID=A0ACC2G551_DALPE|nr:hypothetical protein DPEC_G00208620 [Dallia pectoralis]